MKKKILSICLVAVIAVMAITGASLAYLTDTDAEDNVFTVGNIKIDLWENFTESDEDGNSLANLMPTTGKDANGNIINAIKKEVFVSNEGKNDAYVRVHIAIPAMLDSGSEDVPEYAAYNNTLHFNMTKASYEEGKWNWNADKDGSNYPGNGNKWNCYQETINNIIYNVYVVTYESILKPDASTDAAMSQVYLDSKVTSEKIEEIIKVLGEQWHIYVAAEGVQAQGFTDAYTALNEAFGAPGSYEVDWTAVAGVDTAKGEQ